LVGKKINILKRKCHVGINVQNVVFLEVILKLYDVCLMKHIFIAPWTCLHRFDIFIRWPENVRRVNKICSHCWFFFFFYYFWCLFPLSIKFQLYHGNQFYIVIILYIVIFCWILYNFLAVHDSLWLLVVH
jgi:hypothetical protein